MVSESRGCPRRFSLHNRCVLSRAAIRRSIQICFGIPKGVLLESYVSGAAVACSAAAILPFRRVISIGCLWQLIHDANAGPSSIEPASRRSDSSHRPSHQAGGAILRSSVSRRLLDQSSAVKPNPATPKPGSEDRALGNRSAAEPQTSNHFLDPDSLRSHFLMEGSPPLVFLTYLIKCLVSLHQISRASVGDVSGPFARSATRAQQAAPGPRSRRRRLARR
jgi:hypothetical protein